MMDYRILLTYYYITAGTRTLFKWLLTAWERIAVMVLGYPLLFIQAALLILLGIIIIKIWRSRKVHITGKFYGLFYHGMVQKNMEDTERERRIKKRRKKNNEHKL